MKYEDGSLVGRLTKWQMDRTGSDYIQWQSGILEAITRFN